jgi:HSP20 family molecular chaperone IbpA
MKKISIIALFFLSGSVLAHSTMHNDFESMMKRMFKQMQMMDMHHNHLFDKMGKKHKNQKLFMNQSEDENTITLNITLEEINKEDLDIYIEKNLLIIKAEKEISSESSHSKRSFVQKILIPKNADRTGITAQFEDSVLVITIPKTTKTRPEVQQIIIQ